MIKPGGLYVHVPFCEARCTYCNFFSVVHTPVPEHQYRKALLQHLRQFHGMERYPFDTLYVGGGTPSRMPADFFGALRDDLCRFVTLSTDVEYTVEVNPEHVTASYFDGLVNAGVNRISIGIQSLDNVVLKRMGRIHTAETARQAVQLAARRFSQVSVDFIIGVEGMAQEPAVIVREDLLHDVQHVSVYMLEGSRSEALRDNDDRTSDSYLALSDHLEIHGFKQYEISNFAKEGCRCRHNLHYWNGDPYVGLGPSAHSLWDGRRIAANGDLNAFLKGEVGQDVHDCPPEMLMREVMMLRLRTTDGVSRKWFSDRFGVDIFETFESLPEQFPGMVIQEEDGYRLSRTGTLLSNEIFEHVLLDDSGSEV